MASLESFTAARRALLAGLASLGALALLALGGCASGSGSRPRGIDQYVEGAQAYRSGDRAKAVSTLTGAVRADPKLIMPRVMLGTVYRSDKDYTKAAEQYEALVRLDPYTVENHYYLGVCYQFLQRLKESAASYLRALQLSPDDPGSNMNLGLVYLALGQPDDAVRYARRAATLNPESAAAQANLAVALDALGDYANAEAAYRKSLELDSNQGSTLLNFGSNLIMQAKPQEAAKVLSTAVEKADSAWGRKRYGDALAMAGEQEAAIREYEAALKLNPDYYPAMNELGRSLVAQYQQGLQLDESRRGAALAAWRKSLELKPDQPQTRALIEHWSQKKPFAE